MDKDHDASIEKVWQLDKHVDSTYWYKKAFDIDEDNDGFQFLSNGKLKVRQNSGWCGTPPISYETALGSWSKTSDSTVRLDYPYWGGTIINDILIVRISNSELLIKSVRVIYKD
jgi:hypothetical protein